MNRIRKEYNEAKEATAQINPASLKNFQEMAGEIFDHFEKTSKKKTNRSVMLGHVSYYFDEGFEVEEMKMHIEKQIKDSWYRQNPEMFTIARLFPIKDPDQINAVWDRLSYYQSLNQKCLSLENPKESILLLLNCGHQVMRGELIKKYDGECPGCKNPRQTSEECSA
jgi:hypothetical protein